MPIRNIVFALFIASGIGGCGSAQPAPETPAFASKHVLNTLRNFYAGWQETPEGKTVEDAVFVRTLFQEKFNIALPKEAHAQYIVGEPVRKAVLRPGYLVFFLNGKRARHVGVYLDKGCFMHAHDEQGVTISSLQDPMWEKRFAQARRILR